MNYGRTHKETGNRQTYPNSGALFTNDKKRPEKKDPDFNGQAEIDGVEYWISAWTKDSAKGCFTSLSFKKKETRPDTQVRQYNNNHDNVPF